MAVRYTNQKKLEILTYARDNGVAAAERHFGISHQQISTWNRAMKIYTPKPTEYPMETRIAILEYARDNSIKSAAKKFGVSVGIIKIWNNELQVFGPKNNLYTDAQQIEILTYARDFGPMAAANKYGVHPTTIIKWNQRHKIYSKLKTYTPDEIISILTYARDHGCISASRHFNLAIPTLTRWNEKYKIYTKQEPLARTKRTDAERIEMLNAARASYDRMPAYSRSARMAFIDVAQKFGVSSDQLSRWNRKYKIVPVRPTNRRGLNRTEIDSIQHVLNTSRGRVAATSRKTGVSAYVIGKLKKSGKISFSPAPVDGDAEMPVGMRKSIAIGKIIGALMAAKTR